MATLFIRDLDPELHRFIKQQAATSRMTIQDWIPALIRQIPGAPQVGRKLVGDEVDPVTGKGRRKERAS